MSPSKATPNTTQKRVHAMRTPAEKERRREKLAQLTSALTGVQTTLNEEAKQIATTHGRSLSWTHRAPRLGGKMLRKKRAAHAWNAFVSRELKAVNSELPEGSRHRLTAFMRDNHAQLQARYVRLSCDERKKLEQALTAARLEKEKCKRASPKAMQKDVNATFSSMDMEWDAVTARTGVEGFYLAVRGDIEHYHEPKDYFSPKARSFFSDVLGLDPGRVALQFEAYVVGGFNQDTVKGAKRSVSQEISTCRKIIQEGLEAVLAKHGVTGKVVMNYANYERKIVEVWGVDLHGWPEGKVMNPGGLHTRQRVQTLLTALESGACGWIKLTDAELEDRIANNKARAEAGEEIYKPRKKAGKKSASKSSEFIDDEEMDVN